MILLLLVFVKFLSLMELGGVGDRGYTGKDPNLMKAMSALSDL